MRADRLRPGDIVVIVGAEVESVFTEDDSTFVTYRDTARTGEVFDADDEIVVAREEEP